MSEIFKISLIAFMFCALGQSEGMIFNFYQEYLKNSNIPEWLQKPLGTCYKCFTGQVCLWYYLLKYWDHYDLVNHLFFISAGILTAMVYNKIYCWLR